MGFCGLTSAGDLVTTRVYSPERAVSVRHDVYTGSHCAIDRSTGEVV